MPRLLLILLAAILSIAPWSALAQEGGDPSELFLNAYMAVQQGEKLEQDGKLKNALSKYRYAASLLDQIRDRTPNWQPPIVDYRRKRTAESIARIEQKVGEETPGRNRLPENEPVLPGFEAPLPERGDTARPAPMPESGRGGGETLDQARGRISQLQNQLKQSQEQLKTVEDDKRTLAQRLDDTMKRLDRSKVSEAELKTNLEQLQASLKNAGGEGDRASAGRKTIEEELARVRKELEETQADRDAADEHNTELARRVGKVRKQAETFAKDRAAADQRTKDLEAKFADASKLAKNLEEAQKQVASLTQDRDTNRAAAEDLNQKVTAAQRDVLAIEKERDAAREASAKVRQKLDDAQKQVAAVSQERDVIAKQRDDALVQVAKAKESQKQVDKLLADNSTLMAKLNDAEKTIQSFNADAPQKDREIATLKKEVGGVRDELAAAQKQNQESQASISDLQLQLENTGSELAQVKMEGSGAKERQKLVEENDMLRGIVQREFKEQVRRDQIKKLVLGELQKLEVQSSVLMEQINYLGGPVVKLTEQERALFKQPQIEILDSESSSTSISIAAPKADSATSPVQAREPKTVKPDAAPTDPLPLPAASPTPAATEMATLTKPDGTTIKPDEDIPLKDETGKTSVAAPQPPKREPQKKSETDSAAAPQVETQINPNLPDDLQPLARDAKEKFERGQYREAEKVYEKMLTKSPNNVYILSNLGVVRFRAGKMKLAEEAFKKAIAVAPEDAFSHCTLGIVYYQQGKYDDAITALTKAIAINPKYAIAHNYLGITASQKGWPEAALKELETAIALDPNYADAHFNLAVIYATQQPPNKEMARKYYKRAVELGADPDTALEQLIK